MTDENNEIKLLSDQIFWIRVIRYILIVIVILIISVTTCTMNKTRTMESLIKSGVPAMEAHCAVYYGDDSYNDIICAFIEKNPKEKK